MRINIFNCSFQVMFPVLILSKNSVVAVATLSLKISVEVWQLMGNLSHLLTPPAKILDVCSALT